MTTPHRHPTEPLRVTRGLRRTGPARVALAATGLLLGSMLLGGCGSSTPAAPQTTTITVTPTPSASSATATPTSTTSTTSTSSTTAALSPPTTFAEATARLATGTVDAAAGNAFTSPSGNIFCTVSNAGGTPVGCELK
ncbi:MAG: hypothetical protein M3Y26_06875, partial [Actinomycetota bacterium]|nr:hypothetical protein [Actinomycetota bacterium]